MVQPDRHDYPAEQRSVSAARRRLLVGRRDELDQHLAGARSSLIDAVVKGLLVMALVAVPASLARAFSTGWLPLYSAHLVLGCVAVGLFACRSLLSDRTKAAAIIGVFWAVGLSSLLGMGLAGSGIWWLVISSLLVSLLYSIRAGVLAMALAIIAISAIGVAFCLGYLSVPVNAANFLRSPAAWIVAVIGATLMPLIVFRAVASLNASTVALLLQTGEQREQIRELATHDELTGVPTFTLALDRLEQALLAIPRSGRSVGLLFIDLDGFKAINDSLGHEAGDSVLAMVARRMRLNLRAEDTVARIGGDEFLVILSELRTAEDALLVARKVLRVVREPVLYREREIPVECSIGVAFAASGGSSAAEMIRAADAAMYEAKRAGRNLIRLVPITVQDEVTAG